MSTYAYLGYKALSIEEACIVMNFVDSPEPFKKRMAELLSSDAQLSKDMRRFIADIFTEQLKPRKMGRPSTTRRDKSIYCEVSRELLSGKSLLSAAAVAGELYDGLSEEAALKAFQKIKSGDYDDLPHCVIETSITGEYERTLWVDLVTDDLGEQVRLLEGHSSWKKVCELFP